MTARKSIADQITDLSNPAPLYDPEDDINEESTAKVVRGSYGEEEGEESFHPSLQSGRLRRQAASLLEERDARYKGKKTSRKTLEDDLSDDPSSDEEESDEEESDEDESDEEADLSSFKEIMKLKQIGKDEDDDFTDDDSDEEGEKEGEDSIDETLGQRDKDEDQDDDDDSKDIYSGEIWKQLKNLEESGADVSSEDGDLQEDADREGDRDFEDDDDADDDSDDDTDEDSGNDDLRGRPEDDFEDDLDVEVVSKVNLNEEIQKGIAAKNQQGLWDNFLEARIKLQKALQLTNQLPQYTTHHSYVELGDEELKEGVLEGQSKLRRLLKVLCKLQDELLLQNPEMRHIVTGEKQKANDSDEEIPSDEDEMETGKDGEEAEKNLKRKIDLTDPGRELAKRHKRFVEYRNTVIHSWYDKTKLASGKLNSKSFSAFEKSPVEQVQQIMMDKPRLIHRTQQKRSSYKVIGQSEKVVEEVPPEHGDEEQIPFTSRSSNVNDTDPEIFDDDDFYHQLLKELIERKTADTTDPAQLTRQWLAVQKLRSKVKRVVDTRASKGRKLRYNIHPKMVSFMAPKDDSTMTDEARDELFSSLFGQTRNMAEEGVR